MTSETPLPAPKKRTGLIVGIIIAAVLTPILLIGGILVWAWFDNEATHGVRDKPNADHLTSMPTGPLPTALDRLIWSGMIGDGYEYTSWEHRMISFEEKPTEYWEQRVRGGEWEARGDLLCEVREIENLREFCAMAFTDTVLVVQADQELADQMSPLTELYLARRAGEPFETDWFGLTPPNVDALPTIADAGERMPDVVAPQGLPQQLVAESGPVEGIHWQRGYGDSNQLLMTEYTAFTDHALWGYYASAPGMHPIGDAMCTEADLGGPVCLLAGSDGLIVARGPLLTLEELAPPLLDAVG